MSETITNKQTNDIIDQSDIITETENGIVYSDKNCWNYIPDDRIDKTDDTVYYEKESVPEYNTVAQKDSYLDDNVIDEYYTEKANYIMGLDFYELANKVYTNTIGSSISSKEMDLGNFSYITIESEENTDKNSVIEYSISSGVNSISIIPENHSRRIRERLSYQMDTRFPIDRSSDEPVYYEDGVRIIDSLPQDVQSWIEHDYIIEYTAGGDPYKIVPPNSKIRVCVTIWYSGSVKNLMVKKYGGELKWN